MKSTAVQRVANATDLFLCVVATLAALNLVRAIGVLVELVTIGPIGGGDVVHHLFGAVSDHWVIGYSEINATGGLLSLLSLAAAWRWRKKWAPRNAALVVQIAVALWLLASSYRLMALLVLGLTIGWQMAGGGRIVWVVAVSWGLSLLLCLLPYDISLRNLDGPGRMETTLHCATDAANREYLDNRRACVGSDSPVYNEPTRVWVW